MAEMADPAVQADTAKFREHSKALAEMQPLVEHSASTRTSSRRSPATQELLKDPDMRELAQEEIKTLETPRATSCSHEIKSCSFRRIPNDAEERRARNPRRHRRRRSRALRRRTCSGCTRATPSGRAGGSRS